jgi:hypothetical protein
VSFLEDNLAVLAVRHPLAARALGNQVPQLANIRILDTPSGAPTAVLDGVFLYGKHDPVRDSAAQVQREIDGACTAVLVVGFGLGYGAEAVRRAFPSRPVLVVEPDTEIFRAAVSCRDLRQLFADEGVHLFINAESDGLPAVLETLPLARPAFLRLRPALRARPGVYRASEETIRSWLLRRDINVNTLNRFGRLWVRNLCRNLDEMVRCPGVAALRGLFEGLPALVIAGGPSLDALAPSLPALQERMVIVSVNTSLRACRERGVEPDFTVVVDPQFWASRSLDWTLAIDGVMVAEPSACPRVFRREAERFFLCSSLFPLGETLEAAFGEKGRLGAGGSVSTSAWDLARLLGARPLYAAGLDLGFPGMRTHCRGSYHEMMWLAAADRFTPVEANGFRALRDIGLFAARSASGGTTATDRRMLLYKWWFENQLRLHRDCKALTLSPDGIAVSGMPLASLADALALPIVRAEIARRMTRVRRIHDTEPGKGQTREKLAAVIEELGEQLAELEALSVRGRAASRELGLLLETHRDAEGCLKDLDAIDRGILALSARTIAGFLIQSVIHGIMGEDEGPRDSKAIVARSEAMYAGIAESASWQRRLLQRSVTALRGDPRTTIPGVSCFR